VYPYIIWSLFQTGVEILLSNFTNKKVEFESLFTCLFIPRDQFWFIFALFFINLLNILLYSALKRKWLILSSIIALAYYLFPLPLSVFSNTFKYLLFFNIGVLASDALLKGNFLKIISEFKFIFLSILLFFAIEYWYVYEIFHGALYSLITALTGLLLVISISYKLQGNNHFTKFLNRLGAYSMEIYIFHILITAGIRILLNHFMGTQNIIVHIASGTILGVLIPFAMAYLFRNKRWFKMGLKFF
jgi:peptidoglycan/LPS O-acetylase OafA/YrhL